MCAENCAKTYNLSREDQDEYAIRSYKNTENATKVCTCEVYYAPEWFSLDQLFEILQPFWNAFQASSSFWPPLHRFTPRFAQCFISRQTGLFALLALAWQGVESGRTWARIGAWSCEYHNYCTKVLTFNQADSISDLSGWIISIIARVKKHSRHKSRIRRTYSYFPSQFSKTRDLIAVENCFSCRFVGNFCAFHSEWLVFWRNCPCHIRTEAKVYHC